MTIISDRTGRSGRGITSEASPAFEIAGQVSSEAGERFPIPRYGMPKTLICSKGQPVRIALHPPQPRARDTLARWLLNPAATRSATSGKPRSPSCGRSWICAKIWRCSARTAQSGAPDKLIPGRSAPCSPRAARNRGCVLSSGHVGGGTMGMGRRAPSYARVLSPCWRSNRVRLSFRHRDAGVMVTPGKRHDLSLIAKIFPGESERFAAPRLTQLAPLGILKGRTLRRIARLNRLMELLDSRENWLHADVGPRCSTARNWPSRSRRGPPSPVRASGMDERRRVEALRRTGRLRLRASAGSLPGSFGREACFEVEGLGTRSARCALCRNDPESLGRATPAGVTLEYVRQSHLLASVGVSAGMRWRALRPAPAACDRPLSVGASIRTNDRCRSGLAFYRDYAAAKLVDLAAGPPQLLFSSTRC